MSETKKIMNGYEAFLSQTIQKLEKNDRYSYYLTQLKAMTGHLYDDILCKALGKFIGENYLENHQKMDLDMALQFMLYDLFQKYQQQCKNYIFDISVVGFEKDTLRQLLVPWDASVGAFCDAVLTSFGCEYGPFFLEHNQDTYVDEYDDEFCFIDAFKTPLYQLNFNLDKHMILDYLTIKFRISFIEEIINDTIFHDSSYEIVKGKGGNIYIDEKLERLYKKHPEQFKIELTNLIAKDYCPMSKKEFNELCKQCNEYRSYQQMISEEDFDV